MTNAPDLNEFFSREPGKSRFDPASLEDKTIISADNIWRLFDKPIKLEGSPKLTGTLHGIGWVVQLNGTTYQNVLLIKNSGSEPFAVKGDAGKLVYTQDDEVLGILVGRMEETGDVQATPPVFTASYACNFRQSGLQPA